MLQYKVPLKMSARNGLYFVSVAYTYFHVCIFNFCVFVPIRLHINEVVMS